MTRRNFRLLFSYLLIHSILIAGSAPLLFGQDLSADSLRRAFAGGSGDRANTLLFLSQTFEHSYPDSALVYAMRMLSVATEKNEGQHIATAQYQLGKIYAKLKEDTLSVRYLKRGLETARSLNNVALVIAGYIHLADYHLANGRPREAIAILHHAEALAPDDRLSSLRKDIYTATGDACKELGLYNNATDNYLKALRITEEIHDVRGSARMFNSIGAVYHRTGDYVQALDYFDRALKINRQHNDKSGTMSNLLNIGVIHQKQKEYEKALSIYRQVLPLSRELADAHTEAIATGNIGSTLVEEGKLTEGLDYLNLALKLKEPIHNVNSTMHTLNDIADVKVRLGDASGAKAVAEKVVQLGEKYELSDQLRYGYLNLSNSYKLMKDFRNAHRFLEKHNALNDSLFGIEKAEQINELQIRYDTERKDMAIQSLEQERRITDAQKRIYALAGGLVLVVLAALYFTQRTKARRNLVLLEKEREVDRLKSDFFANISHEFRTPLSLILGPVETMLGKTQEPTQRFQLELMRKSAARLLRLINQILELSKLQFARPELKATKVNAVEIVKGITSTFQSLADSKGIDLVFDCFDDDISLYCDQEQIETVCINLISNAFKFSDTAGRISVTLKAVPSRDKYPDGEVELLVSDLGIGISREELKHIFDRFYRAGSASEKQYGGTGIGLALTKEIVDLHHGVIDVESEPGRGTTVRVVLPLGTSHLRADQIVVRDNSMLTTSPALRQLLDLPVEPEEVNSREDGERPIVLLIDDNEDMRKYVRSILGDKYSLLEAVNGEAGLNQARAFIPDLIVSDVMMPVMDGYEACRRLKKDEKTSHIPVILLTAKTSLRSRIQGLETEADLYLSKPFVPQELLLNIHNLIQSRRKLRERYNRQVVLKPSEISINSTDELFLQRLMKVVEENYRDENFSVEQLSEEIGMSRSQLHRKLQALTNESASQFIRSFRLQRAMQLLRKSHGSISEIAFAVGFSSHPYFNRCFQEEYGCTPSSVVEKEAASR